MSPLHQMICLLKRVSYIDSLMSTFTVSSLFYAYGFSDSFVATVRATCEDKLDANHVKEGLAPPSGNQFEPG